MEDQLEAELVARLKRGDPSAFDQAFDALRHRLFGFLLRLSRRREVAEDLLQETWLRLATRAPYLRDDTRLAPWLFTVARNLFVSYCRSRSLEGGATLATEPPEREPAAGPSPFEAAAAAELHQRLERAIDRLSLAHREVLLLVAVEGLTPSDAAEVLGIRAEAFRQRLARARAHLSDLLGSTPGRTPQAMADEAEGAAPAGRKGGFSYGGT